MTLLQHLPLDAESTEILEESDRIEGEEQESCCWCEDPSSLLGVSWRWAWNSNFLEDVSSAIWIWVS
jgi:hypothetical protein